MNWVEKVTFVQKFTGLLVQCMWLEAISDAIKM